MLGVLMLGVLSPCAVALEADEATPKAVKHDPPRYPRGAAARGIEGVVKIEFTIDGEGNVVAPRIISATPPGVFDAAALAALAKWKYEARGTETAGMKINIAFKQR